MSVPSKPMAPRRTTRAQSMPNSDTSWGRRISVLPSLGWKKSSNIEIVLDGEDTFIHSYSTFDEIAGHVNLRFERDTCIDDFAIVFQGQTTTWVDKIATTSPTMGRTTGKHTFLRVQQPINQRYLPEYNRALAGETYTIPFKFVVPDRILDFTCTHKVDNDAVRDCHLLLPPSIGDPMLAGKGNTLMDDLAPNMAKISYTIRVGLLKASPTIRKSEVMEEERGIRIIPAREEVPPLSLEHLPERNAEKYCLRKEKNVRKGIFKIGKKQGRLTAESSQPASLKLHQPSQDTGEPVATMAMVRLRFDPASADEEPPSLNSITNKLKSWTFFGAAPWGYFPVPDGYDIWSTMHSQYPETVDLSTRNISNVEWKKHEPGALSAAAPASLTKNVAVPSAYEKRPSKPLSTSIPSSCSAGTHGSRSTANSMNRRASTFSTTSTTSTLTSNDSTGSALSTSQASSDLDLTITSTAHHNTMPSPSTSYNASLPYYTTSIVVPVTLPTTAPTPVQASTSTTTTPSQSRRPSSVSISASNATQLAPSSSQQQFQMNPTKRSKPITFLPTFHSCLINRIYTLELSINANGAPTLNLTIPVQISLPYNSTSSNSNTPQSPLRTPSTAPPAWFDPFQSRSKPDQEYENENDEDLTLENENDEAIARALAQYQYSNQYAFQSQHLGRHLNDVPEYEDIHQPQHQPQHQPPSSTNNETPNVPTIPIPTRRLSLPLPPSSTQQAEEAPPEYHSTVRRVSAARRAASSANSGASSSAGAGDRGGNTADGRTRTIRPGRQGRKWMGSLGFSLLL